MDLKPRRKFVSPNQKSIKLQEGLKKGEVRCTKCLKVKLQKDFTKKNYYWCRKCHNAYSRSRPKKVSYNSLW